MQYLAHTLKDSSSFLGARRVMRLSSTLEQSGRQGNLLGVPTLLARLEAEFDQVRQALIHISG